MKDLRQLLQYAQYLKSINWQVEKIDNTFVYLKKLPFLGSFAKIQRPEKLNSQIIKFIEKKYHPFQFIIEPQTNKDIPLLLKLGFKITSSSYLPTKTLQINLKQSVSDILKKMSSKTRYNIRLAQKKNIRIEKSKNIEDFVDFWRQNFEKKRFSLLSQKKNVLALYKAFNKKADLFLAFKENSLIAGLLVLRTKETAFYMYAVSNSLGRKNFAPTFLTWQAILEAKKNKCQIFDFDGIFDERFPIKSWQGFTKFKKGFGGKETFFPGEFLKFNLKNLIKL